MKGSRFWDFLLDLEGRFFLADVLLSRFRFRHFSPKAIARYQERHISRVLRYALKKAPFYSRHYAGHSIEDFDHLPLTNKSLVMENFSECNTAGLRREEALDFCLENERLHDFSRRLKGLNVGLSSGTSGNKGIEVVSQREESILRAAFFARFDFPKREKINLAFILRVSSPAFSLNRWGHRLSYLTQLDSLENICRKLQDLQPNVLSAPPGMLRLIARAVEQGRLAIRPKRIVSYAEVLYPDDRLYLRQVFDCPIHEIYKCTEGAIAISCRFERLHINEDLVAVELQDRDGSPTPPGQPCHRLIVTDLHKQALPIIRYQLNDIVTLSPGKCPCGSSFRVIESIQGREDELFWGIRTSDGVKHFIYPDYITRKIISTSDDIEEFQAIQHDFTQVELRIVLKPGADAQGITRALQEGIKQVFASYECTGPWVEVFFAEPLPNIHSKKRSRVICLIPNE